MSGGGFGAKIDTYPETIIAASLARRLNRPVRWDGERQEEFTSTIHGRGEVQYVEAAYSSEGRLAGPADQVLHRPRGLQLWRYPRRRRDPDPLGRRRGLHRRELALGGLRRLHQQDDRRPLSRLRPARHRLRRRARYGRHRPRTRTWTQPRSAAAT